MCELFLGEHSVAVGAFFYLYNGGRIERIHLSYLQLDKDIHPGHPLEQVALLFCIITGMP